MANPKDHEEKRKKLFSKYKSDIEKIILSAETAKGNYHITAENINERDRLSLNLEEKKGTRSLVRGYTVENYLNETYPGFDRYIGKIVTKKFAKDAITELAALDKSNSPISNIFAPLAGYVKKDSNYIMVIEMLKHSSFMERFQDDIYIPMSELIKSVELCALLNKHRENSPEVIRLENKMKEICNQNGEKEIFRLGSFSVDDYASFFRNFSCFKRGTEKKVMDAAEYSFREISKKYLANNDLKCLIQHDSQPWHHLVDKLIDAGNLKFGSPGVQLGRFLGYPRIFNKLLSPTEGEINTNILENAEKCIKDLTDYYSGITGFNPDLVNRATYAGSVYGLIRLMPAKDFTEDEKYSLKKTALSQLTILGKTEPAANDLRSSLIRGWGI